MTPDEIKAMSAAEVAEQLQEYQKYRRGEPPYDYGITPHRQPFTPYELGAIIDRAVEILKGEILQDSEYFFVQWYNQYNKMLGESECTSYEAAKERMKDYKSCDKNLGRYFKYRIVRETTKREVVYDE